MAIPRTKKTKTVCILPEDLLEILRTGVVPLKLIKSREIPDGSIFTHAEYDHLHGVIKITFAHVLIPERGPLDVECLEVSNP